jgi:hypothetical protein
MNVDPVAALDDSLKAHGLLTNRTSQGIAIDGSDLVVTAAIVRVEKHPNARIVQLDVPVRSKRLVNGWLIESFSGVGPDESKAIEDAFGKFLRSSIHVLLASLVDAKYGENQVEWESWSVKGKTWRVCMGPLLYRGSNPIHKEYSGLLDRLKHNLLPGLEAGCHCLRVYCMLNGRDCVGSEALLDNIDWPEGRTIVSEWGWPEGMFWVRHFLMLIPDTPTGAKAR